MKPLSVAQMKGTRSASLRQLPLEGSKMRHAYDLFMDNKGIPVVWSSSKNLSKFLKTLNIFYGLDIRQIQRCNKKRGIESKYVLAGEWFGRVYVDYIAERINNDR